MAKDKLVEYDSVANNNTVVGDVNLQESSMLPSDVNNAIRELMSHQKEAFGSGTPLYVDQTNNRVGIGTSSPSAGLHLEGTANNLASQLKVTATGVVSQYIGGSSSEGLAIGHDSGSLPIVFKTGVNSGTGVTGSGTERLRIDSSGNVGIGTSTNTVYYNSTSTYTSSFALKTNISNEVAEIAIINGNNNFGSTIDFARTNTSSNDVRFASLGGYADSNTAGSESGHIRFQTKGASDSNIAERMRIDSSGRLLVGLTSASGSAGAVLQARGNGTAAAVFDRASSNGVVVGFKRNGGNDVGNISITTSNTAYNTSSDYRLKENVDYTFDATTRLKQLKPCRFNFIIDADKTVDGFLAHEVSSIVPEAITGIKDEVDADGNAVMQGIDQSKLVPLLVKTIQELEARITTLEGA